MSVTRSRRVCRETRPSRGVGWLLSETGIPRRIKAAYLDDDTIKYLAAYAARLRGKDTAA